MADGTVWGTGFPVCLWVIVGQCHLCPFGLGPAFASLGQLAPWQMTSFKSGFLGEQWD